MKTATRVAVLLGLLTGLPASALEQRILSGRYPLAPGGGVAVENVQGAIHVEGWDRAEVEITVTKTAAGTGGQPDGVRIMVESGERAVAFYTVYPEESDRPVRVDYRLRVPRQVRLSRLRTVVGDITVRDIEGSVNARSLNGSIEQVNVAGRVEARTINGNIAVSLSALPGARAQLLLEAVNGDLELVLPPKPNADLELDTLAGAIESNYVFRASALPGDTVRRARLGRGGRWCVCAPCGAISE